MNRLMEKLEAGFAGLLWLAATILLPMAALAPVDGGTARAATTQSASNGCSGIAIDMLRVCPATVL